MLLHIPGVFRRDELPEIRQALIQASWQDGRQTAGAQSIRVKSNLQLAEDDPLAVKLGDLIIQRLSENPLFMSAALPSKIYPPMFNCYQDGGEFGMHVDNTIRRPPGSRERVRTDVSSTLFFTDPDEYEGGELVIQDTYGEQRVRLPAGDLVLYPSTSVHCVTPVTRGARICSFFWTQSMVREDSQRRLMFDMDVAIQQLTQDVPDHPALVTLTGTYHNLLRRWAEV